MKWWSIPTAIALLALLLACAVPAEGGISAGCANAECSAPTPTAPIAGGGL